MPEKRKNKTKKCHKCKKVYQNMKQCKVCKCHSVSYCGKECQVEDWPRHSKNCIPVMVKEYGEKGKGLVASKIIKMGELILIDKAVVSNDDIELDIYGFILNEDAERLLINQKILKDISLLNHSCAPNAAMWLLDGKVNRNPEKRFELRAIKDISKEEEVTMFYPGDSVLPLGSFAVPFPFLLSPTSASCLTRKTLQEDFGFDCKCPVCSGEVPNQDDIMRKMWDIIISNGVQTKEEHEMTLSDWTREAKAFEAIVELAKPVYVGRPEGKMAKLLFFLRAAANARKPDLFGKAVNGIRELAEKTGLEAFKGIIQDFSRKEIDTEILTEMMEKGFGLD